jgi:hypothetical protein
LEIKVIKNHLRTGSIWLNAMEQVGAVLKAMKLGKFYDSALKLLGKQERVLVIEMLGQ